MLEAIKRNPVIYLALKMWQFSAGNRHKVIIYFLMAVISNGGSLCAPLVLAKLLNEIQLNGINDRNIYYLLSLLPLFLVITLVSWALHGPSRIMEQTNSFLVRTNYRKYLLGGVLALPMQWHNEHHSGETIDKIGKGTSGLGDFSQDTFEIIKMAARLLGAYFILIYFNIHAAYIVLATTLLASTIIIKFDHVLVGHYYKLNKAENIIAQKIADAINNISTVIILRIENPIFNSIADKIMQPFKLFVKNNKLGELKWFLVSVCATLGKIFVLGSFILMAYKNHSPILIGSLAALYGYVNEINDLFFSFASEYSNIIKRRTRVVNSEEITTDFHLCRKITNGRMPHDWRELSIEKLSFLYSSVEETTDLHLDSISMVIKRGQRVAIIGPSGSGKTTLLQLIKDIYPPTGGMVCIDGYRLSRNFASMDSDVTLIPQDPQIFFNSIRWNMSMGIEYDMEYLRRFSDMACFSDVADQLPKGFDSWINERGVNLSGGEKQRLALARGLMAGADKQIILLDESTSSVDVRNELAIYKNIFAGFPDKTIIASIHKLHLLPMFDMIYLFDDGKIIASGTFDELLTGCPRFQETWAKYSNSEMP